MSISIPYAELSSVYLENFLVGGSLDYWQRIVANPSVQSVSSGKQYTADRFCWEAGGSTTKDFAIIRSSNIPTFSQANYKFNYSYNFTCNTGYSPAAADGLSILSHHIEGYEYARLLGKKVTFSFWVYSSQAGTYPFALKNGNRDRAYIAPYTITAPNTWQFVSIPIQLESTTSFYNFDNTDGLFISFNFAGGTNFNAPTANTWVTGGDYFSVVGMTDIMSTTANTIYYAGLKANIGGAVTPFSLAGGTLARELALCERYYQKSYELETVLGAGDNRGVTYVYSDSFSTTVYSISHAHHFAVMMRGDPTVVTYQTTTNAPNTVSVGGGIVTPSVFENCPRGFRVFATSGTSTLRLLLFHHTAEAEL